MSAGQGGWSCLLQCRLAISSPHHSKCRYCPYYAYTATYRTGQKGRLRRRELRERMRERRRPARPRRSVRPNVFVAQNQLIFPPVQNLCPHLLVQQTQLIQAPPIRDFDHPLHPPLALRRTRHLFPQLTPQQPNRLDRLAHILRQRVLDLPSDPIR